MQYIYIQQRTRFEGLPVSDIRLAEGGDKFSSIITAKKSYLTRFTLSRLEPILGIEHFCRVHQQYIVAMRHIVYFDNEIINLGDREVPLGRAYQKEFYSRITMLK